MIKDKWTDFSDRRDMRVLREIDENDQREELEDLGYDARRGTFQARRLG